MKSLMRFFLVLLLIALSLAAAAFFLFPLPGTIPILMYHYVGSKTQAYEQGNYVSRETFERQMAFLKKAGFRVLSMEEYEQTLKGERKSRGREIMITFDDGESSFATHAVPVLEKYQFPVTMFLVSGHVPTGAMASMDLETVQNLQKKYPWINFQAHSKTHWHFKQQSESQLKEEIYVCKRELEQYLGKPVHYFAYPFGEFDERSMEMVEKAGYHLAFTTSHKKLGSIAENHFAIPRSKIAEDDSNLFVFWGYASGIYSTYKSFYHRFKNQS